jgi:CBS domain containing-hemolysin-like protein
MTPRTDATVIRQNMTFEDILHLVVRSGFSRFPVVGESIDDVKGILLARDLLRAAPRFLKNQNEKFEISTVLRKPLFVPGTKNIDELLKELKNRKVHMAIILDEHGGFDGVVTLEDIVEEIVGEIFDESDGAKFDIIFEQNGDVIIDGGVLVTDINESFNVDLPEGEYDTIAGLILSVLGRMANEGDNITLIGNGMVSINGSAITSLRNGTHHESESDEPTINRSVELNVEKVSGHRIELVRYRIKLDTGEIEFPIIDADSSFLAISEDGGTKVIDLRIKTPTNPKD